MVRSRPALILLDLMRRGSRCCSGHRCRTFMKTSRLFFTLIITTFIPLFTSAAEAHDDHPLVLGVALPLTGPLADAGSTVRDGIEEAAKMQPGISVIFEDTAYTGTG